MKWLLDDKGNVVLRNGHPVYVKDDGTEVEHDLVKTIGTISRLAGEAKTHREAKETAETKLNAFVGIEDPKKALEALETVKNLKDKDFVSAGEVQKVRDEVTRALNAKFEPIVAENATLKKKIDGSVLESAFVGSKFVKEKGAVPADIFQSRFGQHFTVAEGKLSAKDAAGNVIYSDTNPGEVADFDEALTKIVGQYAYKDALLKGSGSNGNGSNGGKPGKPGAKTLTRAEFDKLSPIEQSTTARSGAVITD